MADSVGIGDLNQGWDRDGIGMGFMRPLGFEKYHGNPWGNDPNGPNGGGLRRLPGHINSY